VTTSPAAPTWFIDEFAHAGRENLDVQHVARYDGKMDSEAAAEVALLRTLGLTSQSVVVEFGPGTGQFTLAAARSSARVVAVDVSPPMLKLLTEKAASQGIGNVDVVAAGFLTYEHALPPADFVYSRYALHHLPDFWKAVAFQRMRGMLRTGGVLRLWDVIYSFPLAEAQAEIESWCSTGGDEVEGEWSREELEEHVRDEHSTFSWLLEPMMLQAGFEIVAVDRPDAFNSKYVARAM
jgi:SAM-dependent methyltransferase